MRWAGAADVARRDKTEEACERRICPSLSRPFAAGPASSLFVVGCRRHPSCDTYQVLVPAPRPHYQGLVPAPGPHCTFFSLFSAGSSKQVLEDGLLLLAAAVFVLFWLFFTFLSPPECMRQGRVMVIVLEQRSRAAYAIY